MTQTNIKTLLYGEDPDPRLISVYLKYGHGKKVRSELVECVYRRVDGVIETTEEKFYPFLFVSEECMDTYGDLYKGLFGDVIKLEGPGHYNHLIWFRSYKNYRTFMSSIKDREEEYWHWYKIVGTVETQFLMQKGRTLFKDMAFNDMKRLAIDIEVYAPDGFPNVERADQPIIIIALKDNRGWSMVLHTSEKVESVEGQRYCKDEADMLRKFVSIVRKHDPDVIEGHNIYKFDLPYIARRAKKLDVHTKLGRDNYGELRFWNSRFRAAEKDIQYTATDIRGRHIIDTYFAALSYDVVRRNMENYTLKYLAKYFGVARQDREYVDGNQIAQVWDDDPTTILRYALDDVDETLKISEELSAATFYLTQMVPHSYAKIARSGQSAKIEPLFVREYLRQRHAIPLPEKGVQDHGGYANIFYRGVVGPILYADVESLYPSIMLNYNIQPESDDLQIFQPLLRELTNLRFDWKKQMLSHKKGTDAYRKHEGMQNSAKIVINAFYGNLSTKSFAFNDFSEGERVAVTGQTILKGIIDCSHKDGGVVIECDTDGVMFLPPESVKIGDRKSELAYIESLTERTPDGIVVGHDGTYEKMVSFRTKNYVLKSKNGDVKFKGSAIISRGNEKFVNGFVRQVFRLLLDENIQGIRDLYMEYRQRIVQKSFDISELAVTKTLKKSLKEYEEGIESEGKNRMPQYQIAAFLAREGHFVTPGDRISYYVASTDKKKALVWERAMWAPLYERDEDTSYYLQRLNAAIGKFEPMFHAEDYRTITEVNTGLFPVRTSEIKIPFVKVEAGT
jgi:DNA polymerase elongation subunit (family B)